MSSFNFKNVYNPSLLNDLVAKAQKEKDARTKQIIERIRQDVTEGMKPDIESLFGQSPSLFIDAKGMLQSSHTTQPSSSMHADNSPEEVEETHVVSKNTTNRQRTGILTRIHSLFGHSRRTRRDQQASVHAAVLDKRQLMSGTPVSTAIDNAHFGSPTNGAQAEMLTPPNTISYDLGLSPDGSTFANANLDGKIRIFDAKSGALHMMLEGHTSRVLGVEYNPAGTIIASTSFDKTVRLWDVKTGKQTTVFSIPNLGTEIKWSPDGTTIAADAIEHSLQLINVETGDRKTLPFAGEASRFAFMEGGTSIAVSAGTVMNVYETATGKFLRTLEGLQFQIYAVNASADGSLLAAGDNLGRLAVWDAKTGVKLWQESGHGPMRSIAFSPDGQRMVVGGYTGKLVVYDIAGLKSGKVPIVLKEYQTSICPQSLVFSPSNKSFMVTTSDFGGVTQVFGGIPVAEPTPTPTPPTPTPTPTPEPEPTQETDAINAIADALEAKPNIYARTFVSAVSNWNGSPRTEFTVRFSNPSNTTYIQVAGSCANGGSQRINEVINHPGGMKDATWKFNLSSNSGNTLNGVFTITLYADEARTTVIDRVECTFNNEQNSGSITSEQCAWDDLQQGLLSESPIQPDIKIVKTEGPTLLLSIESPYDQSVVSFPSGGMLSSQALKHEGGTAFNLSRITFNTSLQSGDYPLQLLDRGNGRVLDTVWMHWDKATKKLTAVTPSDMMSTERASQTDTAAFDAIMSLSTANLDDKQLNWIQQVRSYEMTKDLDADHNFYIDGGEGLMAKIFAVRPEYREENWTKAIEALVGPKDRYGRTKMTPRNAKDFFHRNRLDFIRVMRNALGAYEAAMGTIMQKAIDIHIQVSHGADERVQVEQLDMLIAQYLKDPKLAPLGRINVKLPSRQRIMEAAGQVYAKGFAEMIGRQKDVVKFREASDRMRELGLRQTATNEWVAVSEDTTIELPPEMSRRELSLAAKIKSTLASSTNPRIVAYNNAIQNQIALQVAKNLPENATQDEIIQITTVAMADADYDILHDNSVVAASYGTDGYRRYMALHSYSPSVRVTGYTDAEQKAIASTGVGQMFLGMAQAAEHSTVEKLLEIEAMIAAATGIDRIRVHNYVSGPATAKDRPKSLEKLLTLDPTYATIFSHLPETTPRNTTSSASIVGNNVRVRFDYHTKDGRYDRGNIYLLNALGSPINTQEPLTAYFNDQLYVDIPLDRIRQVLQTTYGNVPPTMTLSFKVALWDDGSDAQGLQGNNTTGTLELDLRSLHLSVSDDPIENAILDQMAKQMPVRASDGTWTAYVGSNKHDSDSFNALDINLSGDSDRDKDILAVVGGTISSINPNYGTIVIDHPAIGNTPNWQSKYLHTPLRVTNEYATNGKLKYGFADKNGVISDFRIWEGMPLDAGQKVAIVAGRGMTSDTDFDIHLHQEAIVNGQSINMFNLVEKQWGINIQGSDSPNDSHDVEWIPDLSTPTQKGFYGNRTEKIIFYRDKTQSVDSMGNYWVAWEDGKSVEQMKRVEWKKIDPTGTMGWLRVNTDGSIYFENGKAKHWLPNTLNLWGDI